MKRRYGLAALAAALFMAAVPVGAQNAPMIMKLGTATIKDSPHEWLKIFASHVEKDSGGRIKAEVYPASQLGTNPRMIEQTQLGTIQGDAGSPEFLIGIDSRYQVLSAAGLFKDLPHINRVLQDSKFNKAFLSLGADKGLIGVGLLIGAPSVLVTREPVRKLEDLKNLKIRVLASRLQLAQLRHLGVSPIPMPLGEVLPALQQGAIDGVMGGIPVLTALRFHDTAKYLLETNHGVITAIAVVSKRWFDSLPQDLQQVVMEAGKKASEEVYKFSAEDIDRARKQWIENGGEINKLSGAEQETLMKDLVMVSSKKLESDPKDKAMFEILKTAAERTAE